MKMPSKAQIQANYTNAIPVVAERYKNGVMATNDQKAKSLDGQALYVQRMQDQSVLERRRKGIEAVPDGKWQQNALNKGVSRIGPGMQAGAADQANGYEKTRTALESLTLPPRVADPMQNIDNRLKAVVSTVIAANNK
jgi:hypothetical protein